MGSRSFVAEFVGTLILVLVGVGSVVFGIGLTGSLGVALAFGLVLVGLVYAIGPVSGSHVNPAVTMGMVLSGRIGRPEAVGYWIAQFTGGIAAAALLFWLANLGPNLSTHGTFGSNGFGTQSVLGLNLGGAFLVEVLLTGIFVFVVLSATATWAIPSSAGIAIGFTLATVHFVGLPLDGAGINPARSLGPAIFARGVALSQVWLFIVAPLVGGAVAAAVHRLVRAEE